MLLLDIDHFKQFNDTHGHQIGDHVLRLIAQGLRESIKGRELAARYGGEEFAVLLPDTDLGAAKAVAETIRAAISRKVLRKRSNGEKLLGASPSQSVLRHIKHPKTWMTWFTGRIARYMQPS